MIRCVLLLVTFLFIFTNQGVGQTSSSDFTERPSERWTRPKLVLRGQDSRRGSLFGWNNGSPLELDLDEPLVTDRPDFTEASSTVGAGVAQLEFGYTYLTDKEAGTRLSEHSWGEPLLRFGLGQDWLEFRIAAFPTTQRQTGQSKKNGTQDLYIGTKIGLTPQEGCLPETALILQANVPTGSRAFTSDRFEPGANFIYGWEINDWLSTAGSSQLNYLYDGSDRMAEFAQSWTFAYTLTDEIGAYTEYFGLFPDGADNEQYANGGFTWVLSEDVQFDVRVGTGLNSAAADFFTGAGLSIRLR